MSSAPREETDRLDSSPLNALTIDVEDWVQSVFDNELPLTDRFVRNTHRVLELLAAHHVRGTFFVLGLAAEKAPRLVRDIHSAGHEVQSHGYGHRLVTRQTPGEFRADVLRSKIILEDILGAKISGYRAPAFSITRTTLWALDVLSECGFQFDSSIVPGLSSRYGIPSAPRTPHRWLLDGGATITEVPVATLAIGPLAVPMGGGGYLRMFPGACVRRAIDQINATGHATAIYLHPYEFAPEELGSLRADELGGRRISLKQRVHQGLGRGAVTAKLQRLVGEHRFSTVRDLIDAAAPLPRWDARSHRTARVAVQDIAQREPILS